MAATRKHTMLGQKYFEGAREIQSYQAINLRIFQISRHRGNLEKKILEILLVKGYFSEV